MSKLQKNIQPMGRRERTPRIMYGRRNEITQIPENLREHYDALKGNFRTDRTGKLIISYNTNTLFPKANNGTHGLVRWNNNMGAR